METCPRCNGTGYANAARDSGMEDVPMMLRPIGVYQCPSCNGSGKVGIPLEVIERIIKKLEQKN